VLVLAVAGVAYTNISNQPLVGYWESALFLTLAAVLSIGLGYSSGHVDPKIKLQNPGEHNHQGESRIVVRELGSL
jgi:hypothetical protein